jgi:hypothetical protein
VRWSKIKVDSALRAFNEQVEWRRWLLGKKGKVCGASPSNDNKMPPKYKQYIATRNIRICRESQLERDKKYEL